ncbi:gliding motility-associated C-terminal domain-containing protein [Cecembia lonarensis]|nr:gliding motility-associated C-terminal domain-containing protein [Cecembia lonarensis]
MRKYLFFALLMLISVHLFSGTSLHLNERVYGGFYKSIPSGEKNLLYSKTSDFSSCRDLKEDDIDLSQSFFAICQGEGVQVEVSSSSLPDAEIVWYADETLETELFRGSVLELGPENLTSSRSVYVTLTHEEICKDGIAFSKEVQIEVKTPPSKPEFPFPFSSEQGAFLAPDALELSPYSLTAINGNSENSEVVWVDRNSREIGRGETLNLPENLPLGTFQIEVYVEENGCISESVLVLVEVLPEQPSAPNCTLGAITIVSERIFPCSSNLNCDVIEKDRAVDNNLETFSEIRVKGGLNSGSNGRLSQDILFTNIDGVKNDVVFFTLSFGNKEEVTAWEDYRFVSLQLLNGSARVGEAIFLNNADEIREILDDGSGRYVFRIQSMGNFDRVSVTVRAGSAQEIIVNVHQAEMVIGSPGIPTQAVEVCQGDELAILEVSPFEGTLIRWFDQETDGNQLLSGNVFKLDNISDLEPGLYTYWVNPVRDGCVSRFRYPVELLIHPAPDSNWADVSTEGLFCEGEDIILSPTLIGDGLSLNPDSVEFIWFTDQTATVPVLGNLPGYELDGEGRLRLIAPDSGLYELFLSLRNLETGCASLPGLLQRVELQVLERPKAPSFGQDLFEFCSDILPTLADISALDQEVQLVWYDAEEATEALSPDLLLEDARTYYAGIRNESGCESVDRVSVEVRLLDCSPRLHLTKQPEKLEAVAGEELSYEITLRNEGINTATEIVLVDSLPPGTSLVSAVPEPAAVIGNKISWKIEELANAESFSIGLTLQISPAIPNGSQLENIAYVVEFDGKETLLSTETDLIPVVIVAEAVIDLEKSALIDTLIVGGQLIYRFSVTNQGPSDALGVEITDFFDERLIFSSDNQFDSRLNFEFLEGNLLRWEIDTLLVGEKVDFDLIFESKEDAIPGLIENEALLKSATTLRNSVSAQSNPVLLIPMPETELAFDKVSEFDRYNEGDIVNYVLRVKNMGDFPALNLSIRDIFPSGLDFLVSDPSPLREEEGLLVFGVERLEAGEELLIRVSFLLAASPEGLVNRMEVEGDNVPLQEIASMALSRKEVLLVLDKEVSENMVFQGDRFEYRITVENPEDEHATGLRVVDVLPEEVVFVGGDSGRGSVGFDAVSRTLVWELDTLAGGSTEELLVSVEALLLGESVVNRADLSYREQPSGRSVVAEASHSQVEVPVSELSLEKQVLVDGISIGDTVVYELLLRNTGNVILEELLVFDSLPASMVFLDADIELEGSSGGVLEWSILSLSPGEELRWQYRVLVEWDTSLIGEMLGNTAFYSYSGGSGASNTVVLLVEAPAAAQLELEKFAEFDRYNKGDLVNYTLRLKNVGDVAARNIEIRDIFPSGLDFLVSDPSPLREEEGLLVFGDEGLEAGEELLIRVSFLLAASPEGLVNRMEVEGDNVPLQEIASMALLQKTAALLLNKTVSEPIVEQGAVIEYQILLENQGNGTATGITVLDALPSELEFLSVSSSLGRWEYDPSNRLVKWELDVLEAGQDALLRIRVRAIAVNKGIRNEAEMTLNERLEEGYATRSAVEMDILRFHIPNMISPNSDRINDFWVIEGLDLFVENSVIVVNTSGVEVFRATNYKNDWNAPGLNEGTYFYRLVLKDINNRVTQHQGFVTVLR